MRENRRSQTSIKKVDRQMTDYPENYIDMLKYKLAKDQSECEHEWMDYILLSLPGKMQCKKCMYIREINDK